MVWKIIPLALLVGCHHIPEKPSLVVDVSKQVLEVRVGRTQKTLQCSTAWRGTGQTIGSKKTPLGNMVIVDKIASNDPKYRGRVKGDKLWIGGDYCPKDRCIYIHQSYKPVGTPRSNGCVHLKPNEMDWLFDQIPVGTPIEIRQ